MPIKEVRVAKAGNLLTKQGCKTREETARKLKSSGVKRSHEEHKSKRSRSPIQERIDFDPRAEGDKSPFTKGDLKESKRKSQTLSFIAEAFIV